jgi:pimeloyl-ACP methyl ester carboxylesterase
MEAIVAHRISERLPQIACPTFVVWGQDDRVIPVRDARRFAELIPDVRVELLPDTGHVAMLERPARFNALLEAFLAEAPGERVAPAEPARDAVV